MKLREFVEAILVSRGDARVLEETVDAVAPAVRKVARYSGGLDEDEVRAAMMRGVWKASNSWSPKRCAGFHTYAITVAANELKAVMRTEFKHRERVEPVEQDVFYHTVGGVEDEVTADVRLWAVRKQIVGELGRKVLDTFDGLLQDKKRAEICEDLGVCSFTVWDRVRRIRALGLRI